MMTGLLSFFSLLPVRLLKKRGDEEEGEEDEEVRRKMAVSGIVSSQVGGDGSSCPDHQVITTERYDYRTIEMFQVSISFIL